MKDETKMAERKEYEMPDDYKRSTQNLLNAIELRERLVGMLKIARPAKRAKIVESIAQLDRQIDKHEQALANEYEITQKKCRAEEEYEAQLKETEKLTDLMLADMKVKDPELYLKFKAALSEDEEDQ
jgi:hypothetical protein